MKIKCRHGYASNSNLARKLTLWTQSARTVVSSRLRRNLTKREGLYRFLEDFSSETIHFPRSICAIPTCNTLSNWQEKVVSVATGISRWWSLSLETQIWMGGSISRGVFHRYLSFRTLLKGPGIKVLTFLVGSRPGELKEPGNSLVHLK